MGLHGGGKRALHGVFQRGEGKAGFCERIEAGEATGVEFKLCGEEGEPGEFAGGDHFLGGFFLLLQAGKQRLGAGDLFKQGTVAGGRTVDLAEHAGLQRGEARGGLGAAGFGHGDGTLILVEDGQGDEGAE